MSEEKRFRLTYTVREVRQCIVEAKDERVAKYLVGTTVETVLKEEECDVWLVEEVKE
jgi:hypothetical protein